MKSILLIAIQVLLVCCIGCKDDKTSISQPTPPSVGIIKGIVTDKDSGNTIIGTTIQTLPTTSSTLTNDSGSYSIASVPVGNYKIFPVKTGFISDTLDIKVQENYITIANLFMKQSTSGVPNTPNLSEPADSAIDIPVNPTLIWFVSAGAETYQVQVSLSKTFSTLLYNQSGITITQFPLTGLTKLQNYYWRVRASNSLGNSGWSAPRLLTTTLGTVPSAPAIAFPQNNATGVVNSPVISWVSSIGVTSYTLQISISTSFNSFVYNISNIKDTIKQIPLLDSAKTYYARVNATNSAGNSAWSSVRSFTTLGSVPQIVVQSYPANSAVSIPLSITLSWKASYGAVSYAVQVSTLPDFSSLFLDKSGISSLNQTMSSLKGSTTYYWRVRAANPIGNSAWSNPAWVFTTMNVPPELPLLNSPADAAIGVILTPELSWFPSNYATSYRLQVSTSSAFVILVYDDSTIYTTSKQISGLVNGTKYFWRVSANNLIGKSDWSNIWSFSTVAGPCLSGATLQHSGKIYNTVQIGSQCWIKENLDVGSMIAGSTEQTNNSVIEKYCYNNDPANCATYGGLYQWAEAVQYKNGATNVTSPNPPFNGNVQGICPTGWHLPTQAEFQTLSTTVSGNSNALKSIGQGSGSGAGTNTTGFAALLSGYRYLIDGEFLDSHYSYFWSSTESSVTYASYMSLYGYSSNININYNNKLVGFSVRCIKD